MFLPSNNESLTVNIHFFEKLVQTVIALSGAIFGLYINLWYGRISGLILIAIMVGVIYELYLGSQGWVLQQGQPRRITKYRWYENVSFPTMFTVITVCSNHLSYYTTNYIANYVPDSIIKLFSMDSSYVGLVIVGLIMILSISKIIIENSLNELKIIMAYAMSLIIMICYTIFLTLIFGNIVLNIGTFAIFVGYIYWLLDELFVYC